MSTTVIYNGVEIRNCLTKRFEQVTVMDPSDTDKEYDKFTVRVAGYVHKIYQSLSPTVGVMETVNPNSGLSIGPNSVAANQMRARRLLMEPRKQFKMTVGEVPLLECGPRLTETAGDETTVEVAYNDVNNGPKPRACSITSIVGTNLMPIEFEIEICMIDCVNPQNYTGIINNRWAMADQIDQDWYTTRTITGRLRVADVNLNPQAMRSLFVPPLQHGFKRDTIEATTSIDGLTVDYRVVDKEVLASCPAPGTTWEGTHTLSTGDGAQTHGEVSVSMKGPRDANKLEMIQAMALICQQKLDLLNLKNFITQAAIVDHLHENRVEMRVQVDHSGVETNPIALLNLPRGTFGKIIELPGYDHNLSRVPSVFGTATVTGLFVSYLQSPCSPRHNIPGTTATPPEPEGGEERSENPKTYTYGGDLPIDNEIANNYSQEAAVGVYTFYEMEVAYPQDQNTIALPIAKSANTAVDPYAPSLAFVRLAPPVMFRKVTVTATRLGRPPLMPAARSVLDLPGQQKIHMLKAKPTFTTPQITADGKTRRYTTILEVEYALARPVLNNELFGLGKIPWDTSDLVDNAVNPSEIFSTDLLQ